MRVVIAEDNVILAEGMSLLLRGEGHEVVATVGNGEEFLKAVVERRPDVAVVDVRMPPTFLDEGIHASLRARKLVPGLPVLVFSQYVEQTYAGRLLADGHGGVGYLLKDRVARVDEFLRALEHVSEGGTVMDPDVVEQLMVQHHDPLASLTNREREVLARMAQGYANAEIATLLFVTERSVHKHVGNIFAKLDLPPEDSGHRRVLAVLAHLGA